MILLYTIPLGLLTFLALWLWALANTLRFERDYFWLILLLLIPPLGLVAYFVNFRVLGDERRGLSAYRRRHQAVARVAALSEDLKESDIAGRREELAEHLFELGQWEDCLRTLKPLLDSHGEEVKLQLMTARCLMMTGRREAALVHYEYVFDESPSHDSWQGTLEFGGLLAALGNLDRAANVLETAWRGRSIPEHAVRLARVRFALGRQDEALSVLRKALEDYAGDKAHEGWINEARRLVEEAGRSG